MPFSPTKIEKEFGIRLPKDYVAAVTTVEKTCTNWTESFKTFGNQLSADVDHLINLNRDCRKNPAKYVKLPKEMSKQWPNEYFICGGQAELTFIFFDTKAAKPELLDLNKKVVGPSCVNCKTFQEFADDIIATYKRSQVWAKKIEKQQAAEELRQQQQQERLAKLTAKMKTQPPIKALSAQDLID